jgi:hypothetical protein
MHTVRYVYNTQTFGWTLRGKLPLVMGFLKNKDYGKHLLPKNVISNPIYLLLSPGQHCPIIPPHKSYCCNIEQGTVSQPAILIIMWRMGKDAITGSKGTN